MGILSMLREMSRALHGLALRCLTVPSLPIRTKLNPRGRSFWRSADRSAGAVSTITTTSRASKLAASLVSRSNWSRNRGSFSLSANTTTGRLIQMKSSIWMSVALYIGIAPSGASLARAPVANTDKRAVMINAVFITMYIGTVCSMAKVSLKNFLPIEKGSHP